MATPIDFLNPQTSATKAYAYKSDIKDSFAYSQLQAIKQMILTQFKQQPGTLGQRNQRIYKEGVIDLVKHLIKRLLLLQQVMEGHRLEPKIIQEIQQYLKYHNYEKNMKQYQQNVIKYEQNLQNYSKKIKQLQKQIQMLNKIKQQLKELKDENSSIKKALQYALKSSSNRTSSSSLALTQERNIYLGQILVEEPHYRQFLTNVIQGFMGRVIKSSRQLYSMDMLNPINFHKYFDNKPYILLVVLLKNGYTLAAFSEQAICERMSFDKKGVIISLTNNRCFRSYKRAACFDKSHLIFGNSQLRILNGKDRIFSNLGVNNGYYQNKDHYQADILLGEGQNRQATMQSYQLLQITFK